GGDERPAFVFRVIERKEGATELRGPVDVIRVREAHESTTAYATGAILRFQLELLELHERRVNEPPRGRREVLERSTESILRHRGEHSDRISARRVVRLLSSVDQSADRFARIAFVPSEMTNA